MPRGSRSASSLTTKLAAAPTPAREPVSAAPSAGPTPAPEPEPPAEPPAPASDTVREPEVVKERDSSWLLAQDPAAFTIQLVTLSSLERANAFVARQQRPRDFAIYQLERDGRVLHVVIYGLFGSRAEALAAAQDLPPETGNVEPWVRPVGHVQSAARISRFN